MATMDFNADHFALFQQPRAFRLDVSLLDKRYLDVQARVHPDRFAHAGEAERRLSLQWATCVNEAYQTLKKPMARAKYLLMLAGHDLDDELNTAMPADFFMEQMEWREALAEARVAGNLSELEDMHRRIRQRMEASYVDIAVLLDDERNYSEAADRVRRLMFLEKLLSDIDEAIASLDD